MKQGCMGEKKNTYRIVVGKPEINSWNAWHR
jgi:hypothetical protein